MGLITTVKIGRISNLSDARYAAGMGVAMIGYCIDNQGDKFVDIDNFKEINDWISGIPIVGELDHAIENINSTISEYGVDFIEIPFTKTIPTLDVPIILRINLDQLSSIEAGLDITYLLIDGDDSELNVVQLEQINTLGENYPVLLAAGITSKNVKNLISGTIKGISLKGTDEVKPGFKEYDELADILDLLDDE